MHVSVEATSDSSRKMTVQVPEETIQEVVVTRLKKLARTAKVAGFRPGKVPNSVLKRQFGRQVRAEALAEIIRSSFDDAVKDEKLKLLGTPTITSQQAGDGKGLEYVASFEVYPSIDLDTIDQLELERPVCDVTESTIDTVIERLREQKKTWHNADRGVQEKDRVTINFQGTDDGELVTEGLVENVAVVVGSNQIAPGFESHLLGAETGAHLNFAIELAPDYADKKLAGKTAEFDVDVVKVEEPRVADIDEVFLRSFGIEDGQLATFRAEVESSAKQQIKQAIQRRLKSTVMNALYNNIAVSVPDAMVEQELDRMSASAEEQAKALNVEVQQNVSHDRYKAMAKRRVALALILGEIVTVTGLKTDQARVSSMIEGLAENHPNPEQFIDSYDNHPERKRAIEQLALEDIIVDWVLERARMTDRTLSFDEAMAIPENQPS